MNFLHSENIADLAAALAKAQAKIRGAKKDAPNPFFKSKYADLESVWEACRGPLTDNGLSVAQLPVGGKDGVGLVTVLLHSSGQWIAGEMVLNPAKNDPQSIGSALTYGRRYSLAAVTGVHQTDDDGNEASGRAEAVEADHGPKCEDCKRNITNYKNANGEIIPWKDVAVRGREDHGLNLCAGCQIARRKKAKVHADAACEIVPTDVQGEYEVLGIVTEVIPGSPLVVKCGNELFQVWHKNSVAPQFKEAKGKKASFFCKKTNGFYCVERLNSIGNQRFVDNKPVTELEAGAALV